jgi:hypothetical protein
VRFPYFNFFFVAIWKEIEMVREGGDGEGDGDRDGEEYGEGDGERTRRFFNYFLLLYRAIFQPIEINHYI